jgi:predicted MFS family arabinose efflux permease
LEIGIVLTSTLISSALFTFLAIFYADRIGRRKTLTLLAGLMAISGLIFAFTTNYALLLMAALIGTINVTGTEVGAFLSIEQATMPQTCPAVKRTFAFSLYNTSGTLAVAVGALLGGIPQQLQASLGIATADSFKPLFFLYSMVAVSTAATYLLLSDKIEVHNNPKPEKHQTLSTESRRRISKLSAFFALDSFAGGFVLQSIVAYWFFTRFEAPLGSVATIFFGANVLTAVSFLAAAKLASKLGLIRTMVFTHVPSNVLLIMIPLAPSFALALSFYLARMSLSQMDVPTRQSYTLAIVGHEERTAAAGVTNVSRNIAQAVSPSIAGYVLQFVSLSFPFITAGGLKIVYDLLLYFNFKRINPPEELARNNDSAK